MGKFIFSKIAHLQVRTFLRGPPRTFSWEFSEFLENTGTTASLVLDDVYSALRCVFAEFFEKYYAHADPSNTLGFAQIFCEHFKRKRNCITIQDS